MAVVFLFVKHSCTMVSGHCEVFNLIAITNSVNHSKANSFGIEVEPKLVKAFGLASVFKSCRARALPNSKIHIKKSIFKLKGHMKDEMSLFN